MKRTDAGKATLGRTVRKLRSERRLSQEKLAELAGVSRSVIAKIETDATPNLPARALAALAKALRVTACELMGIGREHGASGSCSELVELRDVWVTRDCATELGKVQRDRGATAGLVLQQWAQDRWARQEDDLANDRAAVKARRDRSKK